MLNQTHLKRFHFLVSIRLHQLLDNFISRFTEGKQVCDDKFLRLNKSRPVLLSQLYEKDWFAAKITFATTRFWQTLRKFLAREIKVTVSPRSARHTIHRLWVFNYLAHFFHILFLSSNTYYFTNVLSGTLIIIIFPITEWI